MVEKAPSLGPAPSVSFIIPVYNEAQVISSKIENLRAIIYPRDKMEVIFVDGGSEDGTPDLIQSSRTDGLSVKVLQQGRRKGFNSAIVEGFAETKGEIVCVTGAETEYTPTALSNLVRHFKDPTIGAVTGRQMIKNLDQGVSPRLESAYRSLYDFIREAESCIDSTFDIKGEICAARRSIYEHLVKEPRLIDRGCIDACCSFQAKVDGYRTVYEPDSIYYELSPRSFRDSLKQQVRRAATLIQNMLAFKNMFFRGEFGWFGTMIMPAHFAMLLVLPFVFLSGAAGMVTLVVLSPTDHVFTALTVLSALATILSLQIQAFLKTQLVLVVAAFRLMIGIDTQKFERLRTVR